MHASEVTAHGWHGSGIGIGQSVVYSIALAAQMCSAAAVSSGRAICSSSSLPKPCLSLAFAHIETYAHQLARIANEGSTHEAVVRWRGSCIGQRVTRTVALARYGRL
jgi:hypothetical protein